MSEYTVRKADAIDKTDNDTWQVLAPNFRILGEYQVRYSDYYGFSMARSQAELLNSETESLRNELALAQQIIADCQEQAANLIQSGIEADNALELVNDELVKVQAKLDEWQNGGLREYQAKRAKIAQLKADLENEEAEMAAMNTDNTKLWKENELLQKRLSEPVIDDINSLIGNHIATMPLSFTAWHIEKDSPDDEDEYVDIIERPVVHSDSYRPDYRQVDGITVLCDVCCTQKPVGEISCHLGVLNEETTVCNDCLRDGFTGWKSY